LSGQVSTGRTWTWRLRQLERGVRMPAKLAQLRLARDLRAFLRMEFIATAGRSGLLEGMLSSETPPGLAKRLGIVDTEALEAVLRFGASVGMLTHRRGRYKPRGRVAKALANGRVPEWAAVCEELFVYDAPVTVDTARVLGGGERRDHLSPVADVIARSSLIAEPAIAPVVRAIASGLAEGRVLDIGCGSGAYLRHALEANPRLRGTGIDRSASVVSQASRNLATWGVGERAAVDQGDVLSLQCAADSDYRLGLLINNVYYFTPSEREKVFATLRRLLSGGTLLIVTVVAGKDAFAAHLDIQLRGTAGCSALPSASELAAAVTASGFTRLDTHRLLPGQSLYAFVAS
jgi:4-hydroxy-2,2'-bipyrrole-5-carbaldehyde O-methyltransferase